MTPDVQILNPCPSTENHFEVFTLEPEANLLCGGHRVLRFKAGEPPYFYMFGNDCNGKNPLPINGIIDYSDKTGIKITPLRLIYRNGQLHHVKLFVELIDNPGLAWLTGPRG